MAMDTDLQACKTNFMGFSEEMIRNGFMGTLVKIEDLINIYEENFISLIEAFPSSRMKLAA